MTTKPAAQEPQYNCAHHGIQRGSYCIKCGAICVPATPAPSQPAAREWPPIEFEKEAHRLAREDERGKLLSQCQREIVHEQGFDETGGPTCGCGEVAHPLILIHAATRAMAEYARQQAAAKDAEWRRVVESYKTQVDKRQALLDEMPCGHPRIMMLVSAETGEDLHCWLCDYRDQLRDANTLRVAAERERDSLREALNEILAFHLPGTGQQRGPSFTESDISRWKKLVGA